MRRHISYAAALVALLVALSPIATLAANWFPLGHANYDTLTTAKSLADAPTEGVALPAEAVHAVFTVKAVGVCFDWKGGTPTATSGQCYAAGEHFGVTQSRAMLSKAKVIEKATGGQLHVEYFSN